MAKMGSYCKAYTVNRFRAFSGWTENLENIRKEKKEVDGKEVELARSLSDDDILYLQENYVVTDGIFSDEGIIFSDITDEWIDFCKSDLKFDVADRETPRAETA